MDKCKYCESEMDLLDEDDILGYRQYGCSNEKCQATYTIWGENYDGEWE